MSQSIDWNHVRALAAVSILTLSGCGMLAADEHEAVAEQAATTNEKRVTLSTGMEIEYAEQGDPDGPAVIWLHGFTDSHHTFDLNLRTFPRRYHTFALDMRGHGDSSKPETGYTQADYAADIVAFMDAKGLDSASIVGASMGGLVGHYVATFHPDRVDRLVMMGVASTAVGNPVFAGGLAFFATLSDPMDPEFVRSWVETSYLYPLPSWFIEQSIVEALKVPHRVWMQAGYGIFAEDHSALFGNITAPTLILYGEHDWVFTEDESFELQAAIPNAKLYIYRNAGHSLYGDVPRRMACDVDRFLDGNDSGDPGPIAYFNAEGDVDNCSDLEQPSSTRPPPRVNQSVHSFH